MGRGLVCLWTAGCGVPLLGGGGCLRPCWSPKVHSCPMAGAQEVWDRCSCWDGGHGLGNAGAC